MPYLNPDKLRDPWGHPYIYVRPGATTAYEILSYGADGKLGGAPGTDDEDISSESLSAEQSANVL